MEARTKIQHQPTPNPPQKHPESLWGIYNFYPLQIFELESEMLDWQ